MVRPYIPLKSILWEKLLHQAHWMIPKETSRAYKMSQQGKALVDSQGWQPELSAQNPHGGSRKLFPNSYPLTILMLQHLPTIKSVWQGVTLWIQSTYTTQRHLFTNHSVSLFFYVCSSFTCMDVCYICAVLVGVRRRVQAGIGVTDSYGLPCGCWEQDQILWHLATPSFEPPHSICPRVSLDLACSSKQLYSARGNMGRSPKHVKEVGVFTIYHFLMKI